MAKKAEKNPVPKTKKCRKCSECKDSDHHWIESPEGYLCKHCPATKKYDYDEPCLINWLHKECEQYVPGSGKCMLKVPIRYNDFCEPDDCPKINCQQKPEQSEFDDMIDPEKLKYMFENPTDFHKEDWMADAEDLVNKVCDTLEAAYKKIERLEAHREKKNK